MSNKNELKELMKKAKLEKSSVATQINSPYARYNQQQQLECSLCNMKVTNESMWNMHCNSKKHKDILSEHQQKQQHTKRKLDSELMKPPSLPSNNQTLRNNNNNENEEKLNKKLKLETTTPPQNKTTTIPTTTETVQTKNEVEMNFDQEMEMFNNEINNIDKELEVEIQKRIKRQIQQESLEKNNNKNSKESEQGDLIDSNELIDQIDDQEQRSLNSKIELLESIRFKTKSHFDQLLSQKSKSNSNNSSNSQFVDETLDDIEDDDSSLDFVFYMNKK
ncbi:RING zinc finger-containing protein [Tieghemostelium lacteum]|uniref:RING zinc finger-containing protein n=1 Tax=Tieghemostelium lacteum TaxID=361077 RepID=A0A152A6V9_TIELA|nr:RING zinc finger-containing protein [Tieghemostelium lacteum]|eukprot:KYR01963.1 RING zinc finger-containing protein [Tieghemostelium lacteum]